MLITFNTSFLSHCTHEECMYCATNTSDCCNDISNWDIFLKYSDTESETE